MKVKILGVTTEQETVDLVKLEKWGGTAAGICYMPGTLDDLLEDDDSKKLKRASNCIANTHHSVMEHGNINFGFEEIPKIIAMILNNEKVYSTSEKSARYTVMKTSGKEEELYQKWIEKFSQKIRFTYGRMDEKQATKLAQENARYLISVFTPSTTMEHTINLTQINYVLRWMEKEIARPTDSGFFLALKPVLAEFVEMMKPLVWVDGLEDGQNRELSLFDFSNGWPADFKSETGQYSARYFGSFAQLAQMHRHRTLEYRIIVGGSQLDPEYSQVYIPPIIVSDDKLRGEWKRDFRTLASNFPQGTTVMINERGTVEKFAEKCRKRLCGCAQLEICRQTMETLVTYYQHSPSEKVHDVLRPLVDVNVSEWYSASRDAWCKEFEVLAKPRCKAGWKCTQPCFWKAEEALTRLV